MKNNIDSQVDETLEKCILSTPRKSFFLFAGAGSGKTYSLVLLLKKIRNSIGKDLLLQGKNVAVITFTNAATDEIINRLDYSPIFHISTIHSFVWDLIRYYQTDIKRLYCQYIIEDMEVLEKKLDATQNKATKTYFSNVEKFEYLKERLIKAQTIDKFVYNPNGSNPEHNALKHAEVIKISARMIIKNKVLQQIIAQRYPILLIDESQDTKKELIDAFFEIQRNFADIFTLGLLGDQKQRIYADGKENIESIIPAEWEKPIKRMNYRCAKRIIQLANTIGKAIKSFGCLHNSILPRNLFSIESNFVEKNPSLVKEYNDGDYYNPQTEIKLFTNDKAGKSGRARWYIANKNVIKSGSEYLNKWKVIVSSANAGGQKRSNQIAIVDNHSAFGRSRVALKTFETEKEAQNFFKYATSEIIRFAFLLTDESLTSLAKKVPDLLDYSDNNGIIDYDGDLNLQIYRLFCIDYKNQQYIREILASKE